MKATRLSLLARLRDSPDESAWREFDDTYRELLLRYCQRRGLQTVDAEDVVQKVLATLATSLQRFQLDPARGRFRDYLFRCTRNALWHWTQCPHRDGQQLDTDMGAELEGREPEPAEASVWDEEWIAHHYRRALAQLRTSFDASSMEIFDRSLAGMDVEQLAREFGVTTSAVYKVRQRVRARLEQLIAEQVRLEDEIDAPRV